MEVDDRPVWSYPFGPPEGLRLHPRYAYLRARQPVARVKLRYGDRAWLVTGHADACTVLADRRFSRAPGRDEPRTGPAVSRPGGLMDLDPPGHTVLRDQLAAAFTPGRVAGMRTRAQATADALLDVMTAAGPAADLLVDFAVPLTFAVLADLFGVPPGERDRFTTWAGAVMSTSTAAAGKTGEYAGRLRAGLAAQLRRRRREPSDDLPGVLARAAQEGHLSEQRLPAEAIGLLVLAFETTTAQLVNSVTALQSQPGGWQHVCAAPAAVPAAVEELLRFLPLSAMAGSPRYATEDVELDGAVVRAGEPVLVALAAANRDERVFVDGERLDLTRDPNPHLGFGAGVHHCLGALPARMTLQVGLGTLATRLPRLRPAAGGVTWSTRSFVRRPEALPVRW